MRVEFDGEELPFPDPKSGPARTFVWAIVRGLEGDGDVRGLSHGVMAEGEEFKVVLTTRGLRIEGGDPEGVMRAARAVLDGGYFSECRPEFPIGREEAVRRAVEGYCRVYRWDPGEGLEGRWWWEFEWRVPRRPGLSPGGYTIIPLRVRKAKAGLVAEGNDWEGERAGVLYLDGEHLGRRVTIAYNPGEAEMVVIVHDMLDGMSVRDLKDLGRQIAGAVLAYAYVR